MGNASYEEYVPSIEELHLPKKDYPLVYETYWEVLYHFYIYGQTTGRRSGGINQMAWVSYLFYDLNDKIGPITHLAPNTGEEIEERISSPPAHTPWSQMRTFSNSM